MASLLHLDSSADGSGDAVSRRLTALFARTWQARHRDAGRRCSYRYRDLAADPVPPLDTAYCALGRRAEQHGFPPPAGVPALLGGPAEARAWALTRPLVDELLAADTVLIGAPMYNYAVSALLKAWIDRVSFPGTFVRPDGTASPLAATRVVVVATRGGGYGAGTPLAGHDFQTPYLRAYFGKQGVAAEHVHVVSAEWTLAELVPDLADRREQAAASLAVARDQVAAHAHAEADRCAADRRPDARPDRPAGVA
ncbi:putative acyl carrier protein phosphodiesterase [Actinacidiphila reveromycinica]|uniref:FMN dependent NADH:quinone oxidoreductase n=1 Tax=Actinacidiphila reveromycinica TaxID=659352 RepID=A0A7U3VPR0_9ACTN|nr:NAD(P)H-dependent oxidoreductase [Streptomyces sp. SN-593]BBA98869.1 putative acyl carrier protein phosphodiesterase [Streptomyces sp. SN-593]